VAFKQSWDQRIRWAKGFYQVLLKYGLSLIKGVLINKSFACFDMLMLIFPATLVSLISLLVYSVKLIYIILSGTASLVVAGIIPILLNFSFLYLFLYIIESITTITEWKKILCPSYKKVLYVFTFPIFMFTYIPISIAALFVNVTWKPIHHIYGCSIDRVGNL